MFKIVYVQKLMAQQSNIYARHKDDRFGVGSSTPPNHNKMRNLSP